jgi:hypothetical protein
MRLKRIILSALLLLALSPVVNAAPARRQTRISCNLTFQDEETDECYYANWIIDCGSDGACSFTVSACDDGQGGVDIAFVIGCT